MRSKLKILLGIFLLLLIVSGCASAPDRRDSSLASDRSWTVAKSLANHGSGLMRFCIAKTEGKWSPSKTCDEKQSNVEILYLDPWTKRVFLGASAPSYTNISVAEKERQRIAPSSTDWECFYGALGTAERTKFGYNVCNSALTKGATGAGEAVIGNMFNVVFGTIKKRVAVDADAVLDAAEQANLFIESYRTVFANARTSTEFEKFIQLYRSDDPDKLIPQAMEAIQGAKQAEIMQAAEREKLLAIQRAETVKRRQEYETKRLAEERIQATQAHEREQRLNTWRQSAKVGDNCWVGPRRWDSEQAMLRALIVEIKGPLFRVQYDGRTNTH